MESPLKSKNAERYLFLCERSIHWEHLLANRSCFTLISLAQLESLDERQYDVVVIAGSQERLSALWPEVHEKFPTLPVIGVASEAIGLSKLRYFINLGFHHCITMNPDDFSWVELEKAIYLAKIIKVNQSSPSAETKFFSQIIHDIKLPISTIKHSLISIAEEGQAEIQSELGRIEQATQFIGELLMRGLETSQKKKKALRCTRFNIKFHIAQIMNLVAKQMSAKKINLKFNDALEVTSLVGDIGKIKQIVLNLLGNAMKFTPSGGQIVLSVKTEMKKYDALLHIFVEDSGIGIAEDKLPHIFEDYSQAHGELSEAKGGQGLGLGIVKTNVKDLGGTIRITSVPYKGTKFAVTIPVEKQNNEVKTVLIVEDEMQFSNFIGNIFDREGYRVLQEGSLSGAKECLDQKQVDFIVANLRLGSLSSKELVSHINRTDQQIPIAMLSGWASKRDTDFFQSRGIPVFNKADSFMTPLLTHVQTCLDQGNHGHQTIKAIKGLSKRLNILVVDDADDCKLLVGTYLKHLDAHLVYCCNGREAIEWFKQGIFDLVLMDISMPIMDGIEAAAAMRLWEFRNRLPKTPIVALSGMNLEYDIARCIERGFDAYVPKPVERQRLIRQISQLINPIKKEINQPREVPSQWKSQK